MNERSKNVFTIRNFRLVFFGALVSELGAGLYSFAVSFYILEITGNNAFLQGLYLAVCGLMLLLMTPVGGVIGDRFNKAGIMFVCDYIKGALILAATLLMVLIPSSNAHLVILFFIGFVGNAVSGIFNPAAASLLPSIVSEDSLQQGNAYFSVKSSVLSIFGVILAGIMYSALPVTVLFVIVGVCFILSGVSEMFIRYDHVPSPEKMTVRLALSDMKEGLDYIKTQKAIMALMGAILFVNFFISPIGSNFLPYFIKTDVAGASSYLFDNMLTPELWTSVFSMLIGASSLVGSVILSAGKPKEKCGRSTAVKLCVLAASFIAMTLGYIVFVANGVSINAFLIMLSIGCLLMGFMLVGINIPISTVMMRVVDKDKLSKVSSILSVGSQGLVPIASVLAGIILQRLGSSFLLAACSLGFTVTALMMLFNRNVREI